jgi:hypothetical protein
MACKEVNLKPSKLKTLIKTMFASNVILSQEGLEYSIAMNLYYIVNRFQECNPKWPSAQLEKLRVFETLNPMVKRCILNQTRNY